MQISLPKAGEENDDLRIRAGFDLMAKAWPRRMRNYMPLAAPRSSPKRYRAPKRIVPNWPKR